MRWKHRSRLAGPVNWEASRAALAAVAGAKQAAEKNRFRARAQVYSCRKLVRVPRGPQPPRRRAIRFFPQPVKPTASTDLVKCCMLNAECRLALAYCVVLLLADAPPESFHPHSQNETLIVSNTTESTNFEQANYHLLVLKGNGRWCDPHTE